MTAAAVAAVVAVVHADAQPAQPWQNGGGITRDLVAGAGFRLSLADIDRDGAFSAYPGVQRWFAVVGCGGGVELRFAGRLQVLRTGDDPLLFDGAAAPHCRLPGAPARALNLLLHEGARGAMQRVVPGVPWLGDWPLRGRFDAATLTLHWGLGDARPVAGDAGFWIGVAPR